MSTLLVLWVLSQAPAAGCEISGTVSVEWRGKPKSAVVYVKHVDPALWVRDESPEKILQRGTQFVPQLKVVLLDSVVTFLNQDYKLHSVFSATAGQKFELKESNRDETGAQTFKREGWVHVQCNRHEKMWADILVVQNRFFTVLDHKQYTFKLTGLPAGDYEVVASEPNGALQTTSIKGCKGPRTNVSFKLKAKPDPQHKRIDGSDYQENYGLSGT